MLDIVGKLPGLGDLVEKSLDNLLPSNLKCVGDLLGGLVDLKSGNLVGATKHGRELLTDLKDLAQRLGKRSSDKDGQTWSYEPEPPTGGWRGSSSLQAPNAGGAQLGTQTAEPVTAAKKTAGKPAKTKTEKDAPGPKTGTTAGGKAETQVPKAATRSTTTSAKTEQGFFAMAPDDFMKAIRDGNIPESVKESPEQMRRLQAKMQHITEMNQLMTSLMMAMHQMRMAVIQNVRV